MSADRQPPETAAGAVQREVIIHCHMFKNAGSTFDWSLGRCLGGTFLRHVDDRAMRNGARYLGTFLEENPSLRALSSHHVHLPLPRMEGVRLIPAFILRHPIERAWSVYDFERRQRERTRGSRMAKALPFAEYVAWQMQPQNGITLRDYQTRCCAPGRHPLEATMGETELLAAVRVLKKTPLVGVVDLYDESMVVMEEALSGFRPRIDLAYRPQNVGRYRRESARDRLRTLRDGLLGRKATPVPAAGMDPDERARWVLRAVGRDLARALTRNNEMDLQLYRRARNLVLERFNALDGAGERLAAFRRRCAALSASAH